MSEPTATDRRGYPRVPAHFPVRLLHDGAELPVRAIDVAPGGIKLQCDKVTAYALSRRVGRIEPERSPKLHIELELPLSSGQVSLSTSGRMIYLYILPEEDTVAIGVEFLDLPEESVSALMQFMEESVSPV